LHPVLQVNPITMINTDYALNHHRQIATNNAYICYGLKAGHIRVLSRASAVRALLKGHTAPLTDLAFAPPPAGEASEQQQHGGGELLASGGRDGQLYVWHLQVDDDAQAVNDTQQLRASFTSAAGEISACDGRGANGEGCEELAR
jgi:enhancer of mRNA-decapping protein 4